MGSNDQSDGGMGKREMRKVAGEGNADIKVPESDSRVALRSDLKASDGTGVVEAFRRLTFVLHSRT